MIEGKLEKKTRSWKPERELKNNRQKKFGLHKES
jgi:hypothetical protein